MACPSLDGVLWGLYQPGCPALGVLEKVGKNVSVWDPGLEQAAERMGEGGELACGAGCIALGPQEQVGTLSTGLRAQRRG